MDKLTNFIGGVLDIVNYEGDRQEFIDKFLSGIYLTAFNNLLENLSAEDRKVAIQMIKDESNVRDLLGTFMKDKLESSRVDKALTNSTQKILTEYLKDVSFSLSSKNRSELQKYVASFDL